MGIALERALYYSDGPASTNLHPVYTLCLFRSLGEELSEEELQEPRQPCRCYWASIWYPDNLLMQRMIEEIEKASATLLLFFLSLSELLQDMLDLADKETQGFSWRGEWLPLPNEGPSPKRKDNM